MILFNCSCGRRHSFFFPCNGVIDINSIEDVSDKEAEAYAKDVEEEKNYGWSEN